MKSPQKIPHQMPSSSIFLILVIIPICFVALTESLMCYQCAGTDANDECVVDLQGMLNTTRNYTTHPYYAKDCTKTNPEWKYCMIETYETNGAFTFYHRGCHDGKSFANKIINESRFQNLPPNNFSTCAMINDINKVVCYRFCDTDFCNGPQSDVNNTAPSQLLFMNEPIRVKMWTFEMAVALVIGWISGYSLV